MRVRNSRCGPYGGLLPAAEGIMMRRGAAMSVITSARSVTTPTAIRTLAIDIGGTGLKALVLSLDGTALTDRVRVETPRPATPEAILGALWPLVEPLGEYHRISIGFPGVVIA